MKGIRIVLLVLFAFAFAQEASAGTLIRLSRGEEKLENARKSGEWFFYIEDAYAASKASGKPILANFTGSDWCGWCKRLKSEVFATPEFQKWAKENVILLELDYPRTFALPEDLKSQNASLQYTFQVSGYPTIWIFNMNMNKETNQFNIEPLGKTGYLAGGPTEWIKNAVLIMNNGK